MCMSRGRVQGRFRLSLLLRLATDKRTETDFLQPQTGGVVHEARPGGSRMNGAAPRPARVVPWRIPFSGRCTTLARDSAAFSASIVTENGQWKP